MVRKWSAAHILQLLPQLPPQLSTRWIQPLEAKLTDIIVEEEAAGTSSMESSSLHSKKQLYLNQGDLDEMVTEMWKKKAELSELAGGLRGDGGLPILKASEDDGRHLCLCLLLALLPSLPNLYHLEIRRLPKMSTPTEAGEQAVEVLCKALLSQQWSSTLRQLTLNKDPAYGTEKGCQHLAQLLSSTYCKLQYLQLDETEMGAGGMRHIAHALERKNTSLTTLHIEYCPDVGDAGVQFLAAVLRNNISSTLSELRLRAIGMTADGLGHLCDALSSDQATSPAGMSAGTHLKLLDVSRNYKIGRPGAVHLANMLDHNRSLHKLHVSEIHSFSAADWSGVILPALARNRVLQSIDMSLCIGVRGDGMLAALLNVLRNNTTIQEINLFDTPLSAAGQAEAVEEELRLNRFRHTLKEMPTSKPSSCRIILCGREYAGKTTLLESLKRLQHLTLYQRIKVWGHTFRHCVFAQSLNSQELSKRTRGIDIHLLKDEQDLRISVWDLAGHREFHALHHLMFPGSGNSAATVFVFTFSPIRSPTEDGAGQVKDHKHLKDDLFYWLKFIASKSKHSLVSKPSVVVVITNRDRLAAQLQGDINLWLAGAQDAITMLVREFHDLVTVRPQPFLVNALAPRDVELKSWMKNMEDSLRDTLSGLPHVPTICDLVAKASTSAPTTTPIISTSEFLNVCKSECQDRAIWYPLDRGEKHWRAVAAYMHDAGELIYDEKLDFIVRNPRWFGQGILGNLIDLFSDHAFSGSSSLFQKVFTCWSKQVDMSRPRNHLPKNGYMSKDALSDLLRVAQQSVPGLNPKDPVEPDQLIKLMLLLNLCYEQKPGDPDTGYLLPALFDDQGFKAANGMRALKWRNYLPQNSTIAGRRLECADPHRTFLTDGFFPRLQVVLHNSAFSKKWVVDSGSDNCILEKNLFSILFNGMEIMVEYSGFTGYFVDILVMSSKSYAETMDFVQLNFTDTIRRFCASQDGCQGVILRESIIRPACLRKATPVLCAYRTNNQVIAIEDLEQKMASTHNYVHSWVEGKDEKGCVLLGAGADSPKVLVDGEDTPSASGAPIPSDDGSSFPKHIFVTKEDALQHTSDQYPNNNVEAGGRRGLALIVSVEKDRPGGQVDRGRLEVLAKALFFETKIIVDPSDIDKLRNDFKEIAESSDLANDDGFLCCINAHGAVSEDGRHYIGISSEKILCVEEDILEPFTTSKHLANKPKVFLINACRGTGHLVDTDNCLHADKCFTDGEPRPVYAARDYLVAFSTSHGDASIRRAQSGTNFVKALVDLGMEAFLTIDVDRIMTRVIDKVTTMEVKMKNKEGKLEPRFQCPEIRRTLAKDLYWRPVRSKPVYS